MRRVCWFLGAWGLRHRSTIFFSEYRATFPASILFRAAVVNVGLGPESDSPSTLTLSIIYEASRRDHVPSSGRTALGSFGEDTGISVNWCYECEGVIPLSRFLRRALVALASGTNRQG